MKFTQSQKDIYFNLYEKDFEKFDSELSHLLNEDTDYMKDSIKIIKKIDRKQKSFPISLMIEFDCLNDPFNGLGSSKISKYLLSFTCEKYKNAIRKIFLLFAFKPNQIEQFRYLCLNEVLVNDA